MKDLFEIYENNKDFLNSQNLIYIRSNAVKIYREFDEKFKESGDPRIITINNTIAKLGNSSNDCLVTLMRFYGGKFTENIFTPLVIR